MKMLVWVLVLIVGATNAFGLQLGTYRAWYSSDHLRIGQNGTGDISFRYGAHDTPALSGISYAQTPEGKIAVSVDKFPGLVLLFYAGKDASLHYDGVKVPTDFIIAQHAQGQYDKSAIENGYLSAVLGTQVEWFHVDDPLLEESRISDQVLQQALESGDSGWACWAAHADLFSGLDTSELRVARNLFYAFHGYRFRSEDLISLFSSHSWYHPTKDNVDGDLRLEEKLGIEKVAKLENRVLSIVTQNDVVSAITRMPLNEYITGAIQGDILLFLTYRFDGDGTFELTCNGREQDGQKQAFHLHGSWRIDGKSMLVTPRSVTFEGEPMDFSPLFDKEFNIGSIEGYRFEVWGSALHFLITLSAPGFEYTADFGYPIKEK